MECAENSMATDTLHRTKGRQQDRFCESINTISLYVILRNKVYSMCLSSVNRQ